MCASSNPTYWRSAWPTKGHGLTVLTCYCTTGEAQGHHRYTVSISVSVRTDKTQQYVPGSAALTGTARVRPAPRCHATHPSIFLPRSPYVFLCRSSLYSRIHKDCHPTGLHSVRNPKILTAGIEVNSKKEILKISYLVK
jgi:hypothetical protein